MDFQIRITETALADLEQILEYSWECFPGVATGFGHAILNHVELLKSFPYIGIPVAGRPHVRQLLHTPIAIYYQIHTQPDYVEVLHFWHTSRWPPAI